MPKLKFIKKKTDVPLAENAELFYPSEEDQARYGFTPVIVSQILGALQIGMTMADAARALLIRPSVVQLWYARNYCNFRYAVDKARVFNEMKHLKRIDDPKVRNTGDSKWILEKLYKEKYGREITLNVNHMYPMIDRMINMFADIATKVIKDPDMLEEMAVLVEQQFSKEKISKEILQIESEVVE